MAQYITDSTAILGTQLEQVKDTLEYLFDFDDTFHSAVDKATDTIPMGDRDTRIPLALAGGGNFGHVDFNGGDLGIGSGPSFDKAVINTVSLRHGVRWTKKTEWSSDSARKGMITVTKELIKQGTKEFRRNLDSLCMQDGTGRLATGTTYTSSTQDSYACTGDGFGTRLLRKGMPVSIFPAASFPASTSRAMVAAGGGVNMGASGGAHAYEIDLIDPSTKTFRLKATVTGGASGDIVVVAGQPTTNPVSVYGIPYHNSVATSGTWLGFTRSATPEIQANRVNAAGAFSLSHARLALNKVRDRVGLNVRNDFTAWLHPCQKQAYEELGQLAIMLNGGGSKLDMYFDNVQMAGVQVKESMSWDKKRIDFLNLKTWGKVVTKPIGYYEQEGKKLFEARSASGSVVAAVDFFLCVIWQLFTRNPAASAYIDGLSVPTGY